MYKKTCEILGVKEEQGRMFYDNILFCVGCRSLLTVFKLDGRRTSTRDIDIAILRSLLSGKFFSNWVSFVKKESIIKVSGQSKSFIIMKLNQ